MHIGAYIKEVFDNGPKNWTVTWLARQLNCDRRNIYNIFIRHSIDTELLMRLSVILQHNFFASLAREYKEEVKAAQMCGDMPQV
ncbi:MAG: XRE family transcriptional regulator [Muribaculaceae bacterium]|nr:XRE family transcriptional regulator [Bacteroidales bacterium]MDE6242553.1 XRE family transcriptional regulator [Muribaculaceae bacterium]